VTWTLLLASSVDRFLSKLDPPIAKRIVAEIGRLQEGPFPHGYKKLKGGSNAYRLRAGDFRILYEADPKTKTIKVYNVNRRDQAYR
jgi:mRNA interferase RelE/StbE